MVEGETVPEMVTIQTREGPVMWSGEIVGPFAIHETAYTDPNDSGGEWTITHRATGYALVATLPDALCALRLAQSLLDLDWSFTSKGDLPDRTELEARDRIHDFLVALNAPKE